MKKFLIGSSALVAMGAFATQASAEPAELRISGQIDVAYSILDQDVSTVNTDGTDGDGIGQGNSSTQLVFDWTGSADNGLDYGARIDWRTAANSIDEQYVFLAGNWGRLVFGGDDGVIDNNVPGGESVLRGGWGFDGNHQTHTNAGAATAFATLTSSTGDDAKFSYYSPNFGGFSIGASYVPEGATAATTTTGSGVLGDNAQVEGTLAYSGDFGGVGLGAGIGYATREVNEVTEDTQGLMAGATISVAGFSVGVGYGDNFDSGCANNAVNCDGGSWINAGVAYSFGAGGVSLGYMDSEIKDAAGGEDEVTQLAIGVDYRMADGLQAFGEVIMIDSKDAATNVENESSQLMLGTRVSF